MLMQTSDGRTYGLHLHFTWIKGLGYEQKMTTLRVEDVDGEHIADCRTTEAARRLHQIHDTCVRLHDPVVCQNSADRDAALR
jgi:hypothetical protein